MSNKIQIWIEIAEEDLSTAEVCVQGGKYLWAMVMCQQAIEKILKEELNNDLAISYIEKTKEAFVWLKSKL